MTETRILTLPELLDLLGYQPHEHVQLAHMPPGGQFRATVHPYAQPLPNPTPGTDCWFGVNPVTPVDTGRPGAQHVTRLAAIWADLDVKAGGCPDYDTARHIIDDLAALLGTRPVALTMSGHGIQPYWAIEDGAISDANRPTIRALLRRWGRLVAHVAQRRDSGVDSVFDLPRILRTPGGQNHKNPEAPIPVVCLADTGAPITLERLADTLAENGIPELDEDLADPGQIISAPADWAWGERTCTYAQRMIAGWARDTPDARHPWLVAQTTRLAALHRAGCITQDDHAGAIQALAQRFRTLLTGGQPRKENPGEINDAIGWGIQQCAGMTDERMGREIGNRHGMHGHDDQILAERIITNIAGHTAAPATDRPRLTVVPPVDGATALAADPAQQPSIRRHTDDGNAHALIQAYGSVIRYCAERGRWLHWETNRWVWQPAGGGYVRELAKDVARRYADDNPGDDTARKWGMKSLSSIAVTNALAMADTNPAVTVRLADLDADTWALNTPAGIVDLRTGNISPADPTALHTRLTACAPDPDASDGAWQAFLADTFGDDPELIAYLQRLVGYSATGYIGPHVLPFAYGSGGNGKGVFLETAQAVLGDYATTAPNAFLMARTYSQHETEIARLAGARMVLCSEVNENDRFDESKIKQLTGGDTLTARFMRQDHFTFTPTHHLWLMGNYRPTVTSGGRSFWRRCRLIPFQHEVPDERRIDDLQGILAREHGPAVLAWIIRGAADFAQGGLREPESVTSATAEYAHDQDTVGRFVEEMCYRAPESDVVKVNTREFVTSYERWCSDFGEQPVTAKRLGIELRQRFDIQAKASHGKRFYVGIALHSTNEGDDESVTPDGESVTPERDEWWQR